MTARLIRTIAELERLDLAALPNRPEPRRVLMCTPEHFAVVDVKNPFMEGNVGRVDKERAISEWEALRSTYEAAGYEVLTIDGAEGLEDMVFAANQVLPGLRADGRPYVLLSRMRHPSRRREVPIYRDWFQRRGYNVYELSQDAGHFEGQGDAIWHPGKQLLWGGHGPRTTLRAYEQVSEILGVPVITLALEHPNFYHLDTCFCVLSSDAALYFPGAFDDEGRALLAHVFPRLIEVSEGEATRSLACNAHALESKAVILQQGAVETVARLRAQGFCPIEVDTGEFLKSGGSVFCMKMMIY
jgi:N-dimethylarginine dimethylaminohydrolase